MNNDLNPIEYEKVLMKYLLVNNDIRDKTIPYISETVFEDEQVKNIFTNFMEFQDKYDAYPSPKDLSDLIDRKAPMLSESFNDIIKTDVSDSNDKYVFDALEDFIKRKMIWQNVIDIKEIIDNGEIDDTSSFADRIKDTTGFTFDASIGVSLKDSLDGYFDHISSPTAKIPTGIKTIDTLIGGGIKKKAMTLFVAPPNAGKSLAKCSIATNMALNGYKALYVTLEMDEYAVLSRLLCNLFDMPLADLEGSKKEKLKEILVMTIEVIIIIITCCCLMSVNDYHKR